VKKRLPLKPKDPSLSPKELEVLVRRKLEALKKKAKAHRKRHEETPPPTVEVIQHTNVPDPKIVKTYTLIQRTETGARLKKADGTIVKVSGKKYLRLKKKGLIIKPPPPKPERKLPKSVRRAQPPKGFHAILCGDDRVTIMDTMNDENTDILAYHHRMGRTMHLLVKDLRPRDSVTEAINFLRTIKRTLKE
jgi:hypothetical protein